VILATISLLAVLLVGACVLIQYEVFRQTGKLLPGLPIRARQRVLVVIVACMIGHVLHIALYALTYAILLRFEGFGGIGGVFEGTVTDYIYFSLTSYTTLGIGEIHPFGPVRMIVGVQALNGFLMITWSASFTYLMMQRYWHPDPER
jgi:hypothetical protein